MRRKIDAWMTGYLRRLFSIGAALAVAGLWIGMKAASKESIFFENAANTSGIQFVLNNSATPEKHQIETMIGGVAVLDYNSDGRPDIYFVNGAQLPSMSKSDAKYWNRLYRNDGGGRFTDVTVLAGVKGDGYGMGVATGDYDNDGKEDIFIAGVNRNQLLHNNGNGTFTDVTEKAGLQGQFKENEKPFSVAAGWFDYNNDGLLDLFVVDYVKWSLQDEPVCKSGNIRAYCSPNSFPGQSDMLFRNNGDGTFTDVSESSGIAKTVGKGMGVAFADYDGDGYIDIFVANDTFRNFLFHNKGNGTFEEVGIIQGIAYNENGKSIAGMGAAFGDVDNDGRPDIFVTGMNADTFPLFRNMGSYFNDVTSASGIATETRRFTGWGNGIEDFDNDGWKDLFTANSTILDNSEEVDRLPYPQKNLLLKNLANGRFADVSASASWNKAAPHRGAAFADLDGDGRMDVVTAVLNGSPEILMNRTRNANHWIIVDLEGTKSNRDGLGAKVLLRTGSLTQYKEATTSIGYSSASDRRVHFGLGAARQADAISVTWPSGQKQSLANIPSDQVLHIKER